MTIAVFSLSSPQSPPSPSPKLGDKVYTTDDPGKVSTRRRRGSLLVGRVVDKGGNTLTQKLEEAEVQNRQDTLGSHKVNLIHKDGNSEGVWATYLTPEDKTAYKTSSGTYKAVLLNDPLGWQGRQWGDVIVATTRGLARPIARWQDNPMSL